LILSQDVAILGLSSLVETRDENTGRHILRTQRYIHALAHRLRRLPKYKKVIDDQNIDLIYKSAPLHDIGKVGIPDRILYKPGKLTTDEFEVMKTHAVIGGQTIQKAEKMLGGNVHIPYLKHAYEMMISHHEKWDGSGYPYGLKGEAIPLSGRLMALADVYDALISERAYKPAYSHENARQNIVEEKGRHFDPDVVDAFLQEEETFRRIALEFADHKKAAPKAG
jgi:response regulator RpfG family c-di-GMP phosphodiesterase